MGFRDSLRFALDSKGILVKELSQKTGISENTLKSYLKESSAEPTISKVCLIAKALDMSIDTLATGENQKIPTERNPSIVEINKYLTKLDEKDIKVILNLTKALYEKY